MHGTIYSDKAILGSTENILGLNRSKHLHRQLVNLKLIFLVIIDSNKQYY